ncbi:MAG: RNA polymerase sigma factor [Phycisphaerales bacterium]
MIRSADIVSEELLVLAAQAGDVAAFERLLRLWLPGMRRHAVRMTGDQAASDDVCQDACAALVGALARVNDPARARACAYRIVTNRSIDWIRSRRRQRRLEHDSRAAPVPAAPVHPTGALDSERRAELIRGACGRLPAELGAVISLYYGESLSIASIAVAIGAPIGTIKSRLHDARTQLRSILERTNP